MWILMLSALAQAGYGDPVDGFPSYDERALHHWTNLTRVAPTAFEDAYIEGGCSIDDFSETERTAKPPLMWHHALNEAARAHTDDMIANDFFDHTGSDGVSATDRIASYYGNPTVGENISIGYPHAKSAVLPGWMCSAGHRDNMMSPDYQEIGLGNRETVRTQAFGGRGATQVPIALGLHAPSIPTLSVGFYADWTNPDGPPDRFDVVVNSAPLAMALMHGSESQGVYSYAGALPQETCVTYHFEAERDDILTKWPAEGSYGWGDCEWTDVELRYINQQFGANADPPQSAECSCGSTTPSQAPFALIVWTLMTIRRKSTR